jgi:peptide/nickel transport system permease protein
MSTREPLASVLASRTLVSLQLVAGTAILWLAIATSIGVLGALRPRSWPDRLSVGLVVVGVSAPVFLLGELALYIFVYRLHLLPGSGFVALAEGGVGAWVGHLMLPWLVLSLWFAALYARMWRTSMGDTLAQDFIRTARATGASEARVVLRHGMRAAVSPIITMLGMDIGTLIGGAIIVEKVFNLPGLGNYLLQSVAGKDLSALAAISVVTAVAVTLANLVVDVVHAIIDPRVRYVAAARAS